MKTEKYRILSGSILKLIALAAMLIDHTASVLLRDYEPAISPILAVGGAEITVYKICRLIGRIAFPIYCFLITEGYLHTRNKKRYGINLLIFAFISEIPWNLEHSGTWFYSGQNVFFTLFLGYCGICVYEKYKSNIKKQAVLLFALLFVSIILRADYGCGGFGFILIIYVLREQKLLQAIAGCCVLPATWKAGLAFIPINMYNGKRGFIRGSLMKYIFYAAYPLHMIILYLLKSHFFGY